MYFNRRRKGPETHLVAVLSAWAKTIVAHHLENASSTKRKPILIDKTEKKIITDSTSATETNKQLNRLIELSDSNNELKGAKVDSDISKPTFTYVGKMESEAEAKKRYKPVVNADAKNSSPLLLCLRFTKRIIIIKRLSL